MERFAAFVMRHRVWVSLAWVALTVVGVLIAPQVAGRLKSGTTVNTASYHANTAIAKEYGGAGANPSVLVVDLPRGATADSPAVAAGLAAADRTATAVPGVRDLSFANTGDRALVGAGGTSTLVMVYPPEPGIAVAPPVLDAMSNAITHAVPGTTVHQTGIEQLSAGGTSGGSSVLTELLVGVGLALLVLAWVFGSALALLPLLSAIISVLTMQLAVWGLTYATNIAINPSVQFIVALLGLGLSIDYALLLVNRWREERDQGADNRQAVLHSLHKAGHSVAFSALIASLGLFALMVVPVSFLQGVGLSGLFIPSIAALVALTTIPLLLVTVGPRLDRIRLHHRRSTASDTMWTRTARTIVAWPKTAALLGAGILGTLCAFGLTINIAAPASTSLAANGPAQQGLVALQHDGFPTGVLTPVPIELPAGTDPASTAATLRAVPDLHGVLVANTPAWQHAGSSVIMGLPNSEIGTAHAGSALANLRAAAPHNAMIGGDQVQASDVAHIMSSWFPLLLGLVALLTFVLLARGMRSLLLPAKAVALNVLSVGAAYGVLVLVWQLGWGSNALWGIPATGSISPFVPMLLFGFLFGVSMDYEVFILSRIREAFDRTGRTNDAVVEGVSRTGRLVTSAALILFLALISLSSSPDVTIKMMATGMAAGVLIDALVVRTLLTPALVVLFGRANWYLPGWAARLLRVEPSAPTADPQREGAGHEGAEHESGEHDGEYEHDGAMSAAGTHPSGQA
ncbi:putative membrane protein YdfJ with MMPL/SSD domain [Kitasatospora sp. GAS204A]|uniref:MMPL family transporter n=1 Tax=unclassified Kitasatospora TaxID=2633591 RepID=UPI002476AB06|nr:MMPL family transporter [Kitasatospora sp. GAS204B]MDH6120982.1 putative membrane protein YdfJ with MMPL/SSD domain [Kitasatospora sp. GAS204B]